MKLFKNTLYFRESYTFSTYFYARKQKFINILFLQNNFEKSNFEK